MNDWDLLQDFVKTGSTDAFDQLAARHMDWIYSSILRRVRDPHLAEDAAQAVFTILYEKAPTLRRGTVIPGWLYTTARYVALSAIRRETRRKEHEEMAAITNLSTAVGAQANWQEMEPLLEEAMDNLRGGDREALILRFFKNQNHAGVGEALGITEAAAAKRVGRAVEKLRKFFKRKGAIFSAALIVQLLGAEAVQAAPGTLLTAISGTALTGTVISGSAASATGAAGAGIATTKTSLAIAKGAMQMMMWAKVKTAAAITIAVLAVGGVAAPIVTNAIAEEPVEAVVVVSEEAAEEAVIEEVSMPGDIILDISTGPLTTTISNIEAFLVEAAKGSPMEAQMQPGMLEMLFWRNLQVSIAGISPEFFDLSKGMHIIVTDGVTVSGNLPMAGVLPIPDFQNKLAQMNELGWTATELGEGVYEIMSNNSVNSKGYVCDAGNGYVVLNGHPDNPVEYTKKIAQLFSEWKNPPTPPEGTAVMVTFDVEKFMRLNEQQIQEVIARAQQPDPEEEHRSEFGHKSQMVQLSALAGIAESIQAVRLYLQPNQEALEISTVLIPKENTVLSELSADYSKIEPEYKLIKLLPSDSILAFSFNKSSNLGKVYEAYYNHIQDIFGSNIDPDLTEKASQVFTDLFQAISGETSMSFSPSGPDTFVETNLLFQVEDQEAYRKLHQEAMGAGINWSNEYFSVAGIGLPADIENTYTEEAGTVEGITYNKNLISIKPDEEQIDMDGPEAGIVQIFDLMSVQTQLDAAVGNTVVITGTQGTTDGEAEIKGRLGETLNAIKDNTPRFGTRAEFMEALDATEDKQAFFGGFYLLDYFKMLAPMWKRMTEAMAPQANNFFQSFSPLLETLPDSTHPITFYGAAKPERLKVGLTIPAKAVSETVKAGMQMYMQSMMQPGLERARMQEKRAANIHNLKEIGTGLVMFMNAHNGEMPKDLEELNQFIGVPAVFACPNKPDPLPDEFRSDYIYLPFAQEGARTITITVVDKPDNFKDGICCLFMDGHVQWVKTAGVEENQQLVDALARNNNRELIQRLIPNCNNGEGETFDLDDISTEEVIEEEVEVF